MVDVRQLIPHAIIAAILCFVMPWQHLSTAIDAEFPLNQELSLRKHELSGVTGTLFSSAKTRAFKGNIFFQGSGGKTSKDTAHHLSPPRDEKLRSRKWAVCTTIHSPTQAILDFVDSEVESLAMSFPELFALLPWKHFGRKNVGYLFAILHGAEQIWDFDDDNFLKEGTWPAFPDQSQEGHYRVVRGGDNEDGSPCLAFNPLPLMGGDGDPTPMWPRGFPLNLVRYPCNHTLAPVEDMSTVAVLQSLADHEPDVDGIYRLTRNTPMMFDSSRVQTKALVIPHGTLSPYNAQATLVAQPAFWSLLLPVSVHGRVSDIWRSYIGQRLLWDIGMNVAFIAPLVDQHCMCI